MTTGTVPAVRLGGPFMTAGLIAGPLFMVLAIGQILTRKGFDLSVHPVSALSLGSAGWIQIANFIISGVLMLAFAIGLRRSLHPGKAGTWGPLLFGVYSAGLIGAGIFTADPAFGFPAGAPEGMPETFSWHANLHGMMAMVAFLSLCVSCFVFARRFFAVGKRRWAVYSIASGIVAMVLSAPVPANGASVRLFVATLIAWCWVTAMSFWRPFAN